jgi:hypothetical protein
LLRAGSDHEIRAGHRFGDMIDAALGSCRRVLCLLPHNVESAHPSRRYQCFCRAHPVRTGTQGGASGIEEIIIRVSGVQVPPPLPTMFVRSGEARFAEWREFEELEGTAPVPAQGPAWAHRCAPRRFGSTDLSIGPGQGDAAEPGTSTLILC